MKLMIPKLSELMMNEGTSNINESNSAFRTRTAQETCKEAALRPTPHMLCGELLYQNDLCVLFADTGMGKSLLAVQLADTVSKGHSIGFLTNESPPIPILYIDCELSDKQFQLRYSDQSGDYDFSGNFFRAEIDAESEPGEGQTYEDFIVQSLEKEVTKSGATLLIIDNITYLENDTEKSRKAAPLMKFLKKLKREHDLTILVIAHTPKRSLSNPLTRNDLAGSKMLINFCDSAFAIGESANDPNLRYIKQIKTRNGEMVYGASNVITSQIQKNGNFTCFELMGTTNEKEHLNELSSQELTDLEAKVVELTSQGTSYRMVAARLNLSHSRVQRIVKKYKENCIDTIQ